MPKSATAAAKGGQRIQPGDISDMDRLDAVLDMGADLPIRGLRPSARASRAWARSGMSRSRRHASSRPRRPSTGWSIRSACSATGRRARLFRGPVEGGVTRRYRRHRLAGDPAPRRCAGRGRCDARSGRRLAQHRRRQPHHPGRRRGQPRPGRDEQLGVPVGSEPDRDGARSRRATQRATFVVWSRTRSAGRWSSSCRRSRVGVPPR